MDEWKKDRIGSALRGENPTVIAKMNSGFAVLGDPQFLPGYCILLAYPKVGALNELDCAGRVDFLLDMTLIGDAIQSVCQSIRVNYEILGNTDAFLHAHVFPRYAWEEEERRKTPVWHYPKENWTLPDYQFSIDKHDELKERLRLKLQELMNKAYMLNKEN